MNTFRRAAVTAAAFVLLLSSGCTGAVKPQEPVPQPPEESSAVQTEEVSLPENILGAPSDLVPEVTVDQYAVPENAGMEFVENLKLGWNLGNTFDAADVRSVTAEHELDYESAWCGAVTTIENIAAIKAAGFRTVRIPVSWHNHVDSEDRISEAWMNRVKEVADWCVGMDLYVIINTHHDNAEDWYYPDSAHMERSQQYLKAVWSQIAETFRDYDEHLILESLNEPRLVGTDYEWE
ncbi:MAG: glycoside hydrolase family 5 protein, partial [Oscillospiraceae bacterium]|nr:glycoside hydrolase family 5 protein [Oscillospiraceae bacterium]